MIKCSSTEANFETHFSNGKHHGVCDAPADKGGGGAGFGPHELLEAGLAGCLNIWLRKYASERQIPLIGITSEVSLNREVPGEAIFSYAIELRGPLTEGQRQELILAAQSCPVHQTLSRKISFQPMTAR